MSGLGIHPEKPKFARADALAVAREVCAKLKPFCERMIVAGSLRRRRQWVGDVEVLYIPRLSKVERVRQADLLGGDPAPIFTNLADAGLLMMIADGVINQRKNVHGSITWGEKNKLARHAASGIPVDFFEARAGNWFNYLVCRTGGAESNVRIASAAQKKGWKWHPYGDGFTDDEGNVVRVESEEDVFRLAGLAYLEPHAR